MRLLVAERQGTGLRTIARDMIVTRLGQGVDAAGRLDEGALTRTVETIVDFVDAARAHLVGRTRILATSAVRDAADRDRFVGAVRDATGITAEVLSGEAEARLAFAGAVGGVAAPTPTVVVDIGGGSTELILGARRPVALVSEDLGCVRLTELALPGDPPAPADVERARRHADDALAAAVATLDDVAPGVRRDVRSIVAVAGTATTLAALHLGLPAYDPEAIHGTRLTAAAVSTLAGDLQGETAAAVAARGAPAGAERGPVAPGREDVLLAGALILERAVAQLEVDDVLVSETDLLQGACAETLDGSPWPTN